MYLLLQNFHIYILGLSETKLEADMADGKLHITNYWIFRHDRDEHGGGVAFYVPHQCKADRLQDTEKGMIGIFVD